MKKLLGILVVGLLLSGNAYALETPLKKLSKYFKNGELIKISSYTVPSWPNQYSSIKDGSYKKNPVMVDAFIAFPKKGEGPFPVVIFAHASGGARLFTNEWFKFNRQAAKSLMKKGIAVLFLDNFSARGVRSTSSNQIAVSHFSTYIDAFMALEYLSKDPKINIKKVGITGWSRGGMISLMVSDKRLRDALVSKDLYFAAAQPRSPDCWSAGMFRNPQPIKDTKIWMVLGGADNFTRAEPCVEMGEKIRANGGDIEITVKKGWHHGFTANYKEEYESDPWIFSKCPPWFTEDNGFPSQGVAEWDAPCITKGATIGGDKGGFFRKPFLKFFNETLLN